MYGCGSRHALSAVAELFVVITTGNLPLSAGLPLHVNELKDIEPQLSSLVVLYKIDAVSFLIVLYANRFFIQGF